jgi:hypothetical protein
VHIIIPVCEQENLAVQEPFASSCSMANTSRKKAVGLERSRCHRKCQGNSQYNPSASSAKQSILASCFSSIIDYKFLMAVDGV